MAPRSCFRRCPRPWAIATINRAVACQLEAWDIVWTDWSHHECPLGGGTQDGSGVGGPPEDRNNSFSLLAPPERCADVPQKPCGWMLHGGITRRLPLNGSVRVPTIQEIILFARKSQGKTQSTVAHQKIGGRKFYAMRVGHPGAVSQEILSHLVKQVCAHTKDKLCQLWTESGVLARIPGEQTDKIVFAKLSEFWGQHCLVTSQGGKTDCTRGVYLFDGHCPHKYAIDEMEGCGA